MGLMKDVYRAVNGNLPKVHNDFVVAKSTESTEKWVQKAGGPTHEVKADFADGKSGTGRGYSEAEATGQAYKHRK